ncbi:MAG TPA: hypothetical protein VK638_35495 [Edaphobacter sp.]|nr:hypothetical protein [Edaphobacter sp.]
MTTFAWIILGGLLIAVYCLGKLSEISKSLGAIVKHLEQNSKAFDRLEVHVDDIQRLLHRHWDREHQFEDHLDFEFPERDIRERQRKAPGNL